MDYMKSIGSNPQGNLNTGVWIIQPMQLTLMTTIWFIVEDGFTMPLPQNWVDFLISYSNCWFTDMIVMDTHNQLHHGGVSVTITVLCQVYWISSIRQYVRNWWDIVSPVTSWWENPTEPQTPLPFPRYVSPIHHPLQSPVLIYWWPIHQGRGWREKCIHLPLHMCSYTSCAPGGCEWPYCRDLSVSVSAISSRKSLPHTMMSDNASTFLAAAEDLQRLFESETLKGALEHQNVT